MYNRLSEWSDFKWDKAQREGAVSTCMQSHVYQCGETRTKIPDGAVTQVGPFPYAMQCRFRTLASKISFISIFLIHVLFIFDR